MPIGPEIPPHFLEPVQDPSPLSQSEAGPSVLIGPQIPPTPVAGPQIIPITDEDDEEDAYVPELPPELAATRTAPAGLERRVHGPSFPGHDRHHAPQDDDDDYGPMPMPQGQRDDAADGVREFMEKEERRRKEVEEAAKPKKLQRDEWMLVPPSSSDILGKLSDPTKLKARQFSRSANQTARTAPNNLWTETPAERQQRIADEVSGKKRRAANADTEVVADDGEARRKKRRDEEIRKVVEGHTKSSRGQTLLNMHTSICPTSGKPGPANDKDDANIIWDHSRDMSMGGRLMDDHQRAKLINDAKGLGDRFGTGKSGGFL